MMRKRKRGIFMTNIYTVPNKSRKNFYYENISEPEKAKQQIKGRITKEFTEYCSTPLWVSVLQMSKGLSKLIDDFILKELK